MGHSSVIIMNDLTYDRLKLRNKIITEGRSKLNREMKNGNYVDWLKRDHGVMDMNDVLLDKEFFDSMKKDIEEYRKKRIVYDHDFKRHYLNEWLIKNERKLTLRMIHDKVKSNREAEKERNEANQ